MGWTSPRVIAALAGGAALLILFGLVETRVAEPMFDVGLFRIRAFSTGNLAGLLAALACCSSRSSGCRASTCPATAMASARPRYGPASTCCRSPPGSCWPGRSRASCRTISARARSPPPACWPPRVSFILLDLLTVDFAYWQFALVMLLNGIGMGLFTSPNRAGIMNSLPPGQRGAGSGMA
jgi:hypothetical protein